MTELLPLPALARSALAVVDMQTFFFQQPERRLDLENVVENINRLIAFFECRQFPVMHVITAYHANGSDWDLKMRMKGQPELIEGSPEAAILPGIHVSPAHKIIRKTRYSGFFKTNLAELLHAQHIHRLMVAGAYTHYCVNATVFDAYAHDFVPGLFTDAVISHLPDEAEVMIERMRRNGYHVARTEQFIREAGYQTG